MSASISCVTAHLPTKIESNPELSTRVDTSDEWIRSRTGISQRRLVETGTSTSDLAVEALAEFAAIYRDVPIDALVLATTSPDRTCPATAPEIAARAGLGTIGAYDINSACSGYLYGLATATGLVSAGIARCVALVTSETFSYFVDPFDRNTAPLFGDAATVTIVEPTAAGSGSIGPFDLGADGANLGLLEIPATGTRARSAAGRGNPVTWTHQQYLQMNGRQLFIEAVDRMASSCHTVLERSGLGMDDIDRLIVHQANARIAKALSESLEVSPEKAPGNIASVGNTLASSIPLLLAESARDGIVEPGHRLLITAFGAGLSWGSCIVNWNPHRA
ncbi:MULTISPECIES: beta-ketoacyl-ACP synthase 3 [unclassified Rhodococcus (in: high G+C Gram-positive bacteria)]|uniref:beta-ketoacyl-ACP synthase 3 n=1 Tax=unclassified Rhodococcus (in: high G+C Gram-positive bacteria) TaxID=192944 RepID=UPI0018D326BB|nr:MULTISPECIES: beta-ketoacyl-ACP synthase 3 [unclassified Rhodococcus (in: high G+C Gram-positive bacteria)]